MSAKEAKARLKAARAKEIEQDKTTEDLVGKEVALLEMDARFAREGWPRKMRLRFHNDRLISIKVKSDRLDHLYQHLGEPEIFAVRQKRRLWYDEKRLRLVGCDPLRCEVFDFRKLVGPTLSEADVQKLFRKVIARERRRSRASSNKGASLK
jgi:hypothetical protein